MLRTLHIYTIPSLWDLRHSHGNRYIPIIFVRKCDSAKPFCRNQLLVSLLSRAHSDVALHVLQRMRYKRLAFPYTGSALPPQNVLITPYAAILRPRLVFCYTDWMLAAGYVKSKPNTSRVKVAVKALRSNIE